MRIAVRQAIETELQALLAAQAPAIPFYSTVNERQRPTDPLWTTAEYYSDYATAVCYAGKTRIENGTADIIVYGRAGEGATPALRLAEVIADHFYRTRLPGEIVITDVVPPAEDTAGDAQPWYGVIVSLEVEYYL